MGFQKTAWCWYCSRGHSLRSPWFGYQSQCLLAMWPWACHFASLWELIYKRLDRVKAHYVYFKKHLFDDDGDDDGDGGDEWDEWVKNERRPLRMNATSSGSSTHSRRNTFSTTEKCDFFLVENHYMKGKRNKSSHAFARVQVGHRWWRRELTQ